MAAYPPSASTWAARTSGPRLRAHASRADARMSATPYERARPAETVAGLLASASIFASLTGVAYRPLRLIPLAILLALVAVAIGGRHVRLGMVAVGTGAVCFAVGLAAAVITSNPLW